jgi:hypothetical protein
MLRISSGLEFTLLEKTNISSFCNLKISGSVAKSSVLSPTPANSYIFSRAAVRGSRIFLPKPGKLTAI